MNTIISDTYKEDNTISGIVESDRKRPIRLVGEGSSGRGYLSWDG